MRPWPGGVATARWGTRATARWGTRDAEAIAFCAVPQPRRIQVPPNCDLTLGMRCVDKSRPGHTVWQMSADERFANPAGIVQGGLLGAFADSSMGAAAVTFVEGRRVVAANAEMKISFLGPALVGSELTCEADVVAGGRTVAFVEATITMRTADAGPATPVARASSTYVYKDRR